MEKFNVSKSEIDILLDGTKSEILTLENGKVIKRVAAYAAWAYMARNESVQEVQFIEGQDCPCIPGCPAFPRCKDGNG